ncbi:molybdopterin-binding protein [Alloiococcus sp. CFN-8]|uniref:molybdopterin-binding protein n=1 Tax=Alloiococcus sp. CFN-8 TaxID=3416081 RepID=UPI003CFB8A45
MREIETIKAVGHILCQDITQIIPGEVKGPVFRKGHIIREEDIPVLLSVGKEHLYIWEKTEGILHENEAAEILYSICANEGMTGSDIKEGKIEISSLIDGLFKINREKLRGINSLGEMMIATRHGDTEVKKGDKLAGTRIIPLIIEKEKLDRAVEIGGGEGILKVLPFNYKKVGIVTTGSEVFKGRIKDSFGPVLRDKLSYYPTEIIGQRITDDNKEDIREAILKFIEEGADMVICTGGMSVDPDDKTPGAIMSTGANIISYGAPVLPGAMLLLSYYYNEGREIPILGLPGCVMYAKKTIFDLLLPRLIADDPISKEDLAALGEGGLCLQCDVCTYPNCGFGKGR